MKINKKGFTLIELLVVIAIIGLLSTLAVVSLNSARQKARDARRQSDLKQISTAMELYMSENETYPTNNVSGCTADANGQIAGAELGTLETICSGSGMSIKDADATYLASIPADPTPATSVYQVEVNATNNSYCMMATLEDITDGTYFVCTNGSCYKSATACTGS